MHSSSKKTIIQTCLDLWGAMQSCKTSPVAAFELSKWNADPLSSVVKRESSVGTSHKNTFRKKCALARAPHTTTTHHARALDTPTWTHTSAEIKQSPRWKNKFLGNNKNNFNVFTDGALWGFCSLSAHWLLPTVTMLPLSHWYLRLRVFPEYHVVCASTSPWGCRLRNVHCVLCEVGLCCLWASDTFLFGYRFDVLSDSHELFFLYILRLHPFHSGVTVYSVVSRPT